MSPEVTENVLASLFGKGYQSFFAKGFSEEASAATASVRLPS
jgi:hypothetical protein